MGDKILMVIDIFASLADLALLQWMTDADHENLGSVLSLDDGRPHEQRWYCCEHSNPLVCWMGWTESQFADSYPYPRDMDPCRRSESTFAISD